MHFTDLSRKKNIRTGTQSAFLIDSVALGMLGGPLTAAALGSAFVSVGQFAADKLMEVRMPDSDRPVSLLRDIRKPFGGNSKVLSGTRTKHSTQVTRIAHAQFMHNKRCVIAIYLSFQWLAVATCAM